MLPPRRDRQRLHPGTEGTNRFQGMCPGTPALGEIGLFFPYRGWNRLRKPREGLRSLPRQRRVRGGPDRGSQPRKSPGTQAQKHDGEGTGVRGCGNSEKTSGSALEGRALGCGTPRADTKHGQLQGVQTHSATQRKRVRDVSVFLSDRCSQRIYRQTRNRRWDFMGKCSREQRRRMELSLGWNHHNEYGQRGFRTIYCRMVLKIEVLYKATKHDNAMVKKAS
mmetsp:Transcript_113738/g.232716  ORF Transcript_113738/g.232716 Transcript_113738/m.232716 type:complete len:222 (-) Transcript_113738:74-739(-)